jgi:uncharacterized protein YoxC
VKISQGIPKMLIDSDRVRVKSTLVKKITIEVWVESQVDVTFWRKRFSSQNIICDQKEIIWEFKPIRLFSGTNGKSEIMTNIKNDELKLGPHLLVAIDSDYDYLRGNDKNIYTSPFVFQTYTYSIENYNYYPGQIVEACLTATNNSSYPLKDKVEEAFKKWSFQNYDDFIRFIKQDNSASKESVYKSLDQIEHTTPTELEDKTNKVLCDDLYNKGLQLDNVFLFVNGHKLEDKVKKISRAITSSLRQAAHQAIKGNTEQATKDIRKQYNNSITCPNIQLTALEKGELPLMEKINSDLRTYEDKHKPKELMELTTTLTIKAF